METGLKGCFKQLSKYYRKKVEGLAISSPYASPSDLPFISLPLQTPKYLHSVPVTPLLFILSPLPLRTSAHNMTIHYIREK